MANAQAFMLRLNSKRTGDRVPYGRQHGKVTIGWPCCGRELIDAPSRDVARRIVHEAHYPDDTNYRRSGSATGNLWRFLHEMQRGALLVIPHGQNVYLAEVTGTPEYDETKVKEDIAYFRTAKWLNPESPFTRNETPKSVQSKMRLWQTCIDATDILPDIQSFCDSISPSP